MWRLSSATFFFIKNVEQAMKASYLLSRGRLKELASDAKFMG